MSNENYSTTFSEAPIHASLVQWAKAIIFFKNLSTRLKSLGREASVLYSF
jgi:hypothetical protein